MGYDREVRAARRLRNLVAKELRKNEFRQRVVKNKKQEETPKKITLDDIRKGRFVDD